MRVTGGALDPRRLGKLILWLGLTGALLAGCASKSKEPLVRVVAAPAPALATAGLKPFVADDHGRSNWMFSDAGRLTDPHALKFAAAREAYFNYDTEQAVTLWRELKAANGGFQDYLFHYLVLQCYEQSERWADSLPLYAEFGIEEKQAGWLKDARKRASLPRMALDFPNPAAALPFALRLNGLVVVEVEIEGVKARAMLDTGFTGSWLTKDFARRAGVQIIDHDASVRDINGRKSPADFVLVREVRLGGLTVRNLPAVAGRSLFLALGVGVDAVIGWDVMQYADIVWDFPEKTMTIARPDGPVSATPNLGGRITPVLTVLSPEGRPLDLFLDTGAVNNSGHIGLYDNDGVLATKTSLAGLRRSWIPNVSASLHSFLIRWPRYWSPYSFWLTGHSFHLPGATYYKEVRRKEHLVFADGIVGNGPFLTGRLRVCGVRRIVEFQPSPANAAVARN